METNNMKTKLQIKAENEAVANAMEDDEREINAISKSILALRIKCDIWNTYYIKLLRAIEEFRVDSDYNKFADQRSMLSKERDDAVKTKLKATLGDDYSNYIEYYY